MDTLFGGKTPYAANIGPPRDHVHLRPERSLIQLQDVEERATVVLTRGGTSWPSL